MRLRRRVPAPLAAFALAALALALPAGAQDTRTVNEPRVPPACAALPAALVPVRGARSDSTLAEADEGRLDTERIQRAIDGCAAGRSVRLTASGARHAFVSGALRLKAGVTLVVDSGVTLFASRDPRAFEVTPGSCGVLAPSGRGCRALVTAERADHAGVMGPGAIDGRGWASILGKGGVSWWDLAQQARNTKFSQNNPRLVQTLRSDDFTLYALTLRHSPNFHVVFDRGDGFTAWGVTIDTPQPNARNTDGIDPAGASNVTITRSRINTGDDDVAIKAGTAPSHHISITDSHFFRGHGASIGSETTAGAHHVLVRNLTIDGADNGLRIKSNASRGGRVTDVTYENVCIRRTKHAIEMDTRYTASPDTTGAQFPHFTGVTLRNVRVVDGTRVILRGYDAARPLEMTWDGVTFDVPNAVRVTAEYARLAFGPGPVNLPPAAGAGVVVTAVAPGAGASGSAAPVRKAASAAATTAPAPACTFPTRP